MEKSKITTLIYELQAEYSAEASELFKKIGQSVLTGDAQSANEDAIKAAQNQAKVDVLEELLEKLESEE